MDDVYRLVTGPSNAIAQYRSTNSSISYNHEYQFNRSRQLLQLRF